MRTTCRHPEPVSHGHPGGGAACPRWSFIVETDSEDGTRRLGEALGNLAAPGWVVLLIGPLGAGKTVFARGLLRGAGVPGRVRSPTFTLLNEYRGKIEAWHADLYRLVGDAEFIAIGGDEVLLARDGLVIVEWAERLGGLAPPRRIQVEMSFPPGAGSDNGRNLHMDLAGEAYRDAAAVLASWPGAREGAPAR